jgi:hypothetical protein
MKQLTPDEITEPSVEYIVHSRIRLPDEVRQTLEHFVGVPVRNSTTGETGTRYSIPAYLAREWLKKYDKRR